MRLLRFFAADGGVHVGVRQGDLVRDLGVRETLEPVAAAQLAAAPVLPLKGLRLDAPIRNVPKLLALAGNYKKHIAESGFSDQKTNIWTPQIFGSRTRPSWNRAAVLRCVRTMCSSITKRNWRLLSANA